MIRSIPRLHIAHLPTPIEPMPRLSSLLKGPRLWVKRDDQTGLALGGNKTRKLETLVAEAQSHGARMLITAGAAQSNHCRQTAAAAARFGFDCTLVLNAEQPEEPTGNLLLDNLLGAKVVWTTYEQREQVLKLTFEQAWQAGQRPYLIPYGGSNPTGAAAYACAIQELMQQCAHASAQIASAAIPIPDWIIFPSSSGGTQAGLACGSRLFGYPGKVLGISVDEPKEELQARVAALAASTAELLGENIPFVPADILVNADYLGEGYGIMGEPEREAIQLFARQEGLLLDPVYTGRAAAGLIDLVRKNFFKNEENVLFWHTGGVPALFADKYKLGHS